MLRTAVVVLALVAAANAAQIRRGNEKLPWIFKSNPGPPSKGCEARVALKSFDEANKGKKADVYCRCDKEGHTVNDKETCEHIPKNMLDKLIDWAKTFFLGPEKKACSWLAEANTCVPVVSTQLAGAVKSPSAVTASLEAKVTAESTKIKKELEASMVKMIHSKSTKTTVTKTFSVDDNVISKEWKAPAKGDGFATKDLKGKFDMKIFGAMMQRKSRQAYQIGTFLSELAIAMSQNVRKAPARIAAVKKQREDDEAKAKDKAAAKSSESKWSSKVQLVIQGYSKVKAEVEILRSTEKTTLEAVKKAGGLYTAKMTTVKTSLMKLYQSATKFQTDCTVNKIQKFQQEFQSKVSTLQVEIDTCVKNMPTPPPMPPMPGMPDFGDLGGAMASMSATEITQDNSMAWLSSVKSATEISSSAEVVNFKPDVKITKVESSASLASKTMKFKEVNLEDYETAEDKRLAALESQMDSADKQARHYLEEGPAAAEKEVAAAKARENMHRFLAAVRTEVRRGDKNPEGVKTSKDDLLSAGSDGDKAFTDIHNTFHNARWSEELEKWAKSLGKDKIPEAKLNEQITQYAMHSTIDKAVVLMDKRLVWLKDAAKIATHYMMWALAEQRRGYSITTKGTSEFSKSEEEIVTKYTTMTTKFTAEKTTILANMMAAYDQASQVADEVGTLQEYIKSIVSIAEQQIVAAKSQYSDVSKAVKDLKSKEAAFMAKMKDCKEQTKLKAAVAALIAESSKVETLKCYESFESEMKTVQTSVTQDVMSVHSEIKTILGLYNQAV
jgi:hypothetical protein